MERSSEVTVSCRLSGKACSTNTAYSSSLSRMSLETHCSTPSSDPTSCVAYSDHRSRMAQGSSLASTW
eukprot:CAMPEP_0114120774 /NCGR_PEP_ID=MMETSP0043_2-20121206/6832_1 /TAXON_ID=464988 /ORGANISM="Hemiselmis andersenii, Strain CCMP644" /LENGTH=67 /DNA_ID=CAMNT_0001213427 /DNA_START=165 /DNA_END=368 /DNA_ORIENTATION=-